MRPYAVLIESNILSCITGSSHLASPSEREGKSVFTESFLKLAELVVWSEHPSQILFSPKNCYKCFTELSRYLSLNEILAKKLSNDLWTQNSGVSADAAGLKVQGFHFSLQIRSFLHCRKQNGLRSAQVKYKGYYHASN